MKKKLNVLIVEDSLAPLKLLLRNLKSYSNIIEYDSIQVARSYSEALKIIAEGATFELSILDVLLGGGKDCFDLLRDAGGQRAFGFIFLKTSSRDNKSRINDAGVFDNILDLDNGYYEDSLANAFLRLPSKSGEQVISQPTSITLDLGSGGEKRLSDVNSIIFIEGAGKFCNYFLLDIDKIRVEKNITGTLDQQEELFKKNAYTQFLRVHKSFIVNTDRILAGNKDKRTTGWLSFINSTIKPGEDIHIARYSTEHPNFNELVKRTGFTKL